MLFSNRFYRAFAILRQGGFSGFLHRVKILLGLRGPVPAPSFPGFNPAPRGVNKTLDSSPNPESDDLPLPTLAFSHVLIRAGASISLFELMVALKERGEIAPTLVSFADGPLRSDYEAAGIPVVILPPVLGRLSTVSRLDAVVSDLAAMIQRQNPRLIFANTLLNFPAILAAEKAGVPSVWNVRESEPWNAYFDFLPDSVAQRAIAAIWLPYRVVFVAHATRKVWDDLDFQGNFTVIHNGINLKRFPGRGNAAERDICRDALGLKADDIAILCVGTLCDRKNQMDLVEAIAALPPAIINRAQALFVGDDPGHYADALRRRCSSLPLDIGSCIRFFPPTDMIKSFYMAADLFVLTSKVESFPRVVIEAMAFGLPIITTPVFGVLEQVSEGENALFYSPGDSGALAKHIESLIRDEALRERMSIGSLQRITRMTTFEEMLEAYSRVCLGAIGGAASLRG